MVDVRCSRVTWTNTASASTADAHPTSSSPGWPALLPFRLLLTKADMHILFYLCLVYLPGLRLHGADDCRPGDGLGMVLNHGIDGRLIAGQGRKGGKLGRPVLHGHGLALGGDMVGQIQDIFVVRHALCPPI